MPCVVVPIYSTISTSPDCPEASFFELDFCPLRSRMAFRSLSSWGSQHMFDDKNASPRVLGGSAAGEKVMRVMIEQEICEPQRVDVD